MRAGLCPASVVAGALLVFVTGPRAADKGAASLRVTLDPPTLSAGSLAVVRAVETEPGSRLSGSFAGRRLEFFPVAGGWAALLAIDLDRPPGRAPLHVAAADGSRWTAEVEIAAREFPEERLTVPREYTHPPPETLRRIEREQKLLASLWPKSAGERLWRGPFVAPADGPAGSPFGLRRFFNGEPRSPHAGIDFRSPQGAPVRAANRGHVVLAKDLFFTGNTVVLDHGLGLFTLYVHLSKLEVGRGRTVDKGVEIGKVGATGRVTGPHLHFAARLGEARVDPASLLGRALCEERP